jgi:hypothetical protein
MALPLPNMQGTVSLPGGRRVSRRVAVIGGGAVGLILLVVILYYTYPPFRDRVDQVFGKGKIKVVPIAPAVEYDLVPDEVRPNSYFNIVGKFRDDKGNEVAVNEGYFYVFVDDKESNESGRQLVMQGSLGQKVSSFNKIVPTPGWEQGRYIVKVRDTPLPATELGNLHAGAGPRGAGIYLGQPTGVPSINSIGDITIS